MNVEQKVEKCKNRFLGIVFGCIILVKNVVATVFVEFLWFSDEDSLEDFTLQHATGKQRIIKTLRWRISLTSVFWNAHV